MKEGSDSRLEIVLCDVGGETVDYGQAMRKSPVEVFVIIVVME